MADLIKFRRRRSGSSANPVPQAGEPVYDLGSKKLYVGDGSTSLNALKPIGEQTTVENAKKVTESIGSRAITDIFDGNSSVVNSAKYATSANTANSANKVTGYIGSNAITSIFESNGTTVKSATTATKVGSSTVGGIGTPIYISNGTPTACTMSSLSVGSATKAAQDSSGSSIRDTYASTIDATYGNSTLTLKLKNPNGTQISSQSVTISMSGTVDNASKLNNQPASYYRNADNINAGTLNPSRLPSLYVGDKSVTSAQQSFKLVTYPSTGSSTIGGNTTPVYMNNGAITSCNKYAGGTNLTVNGVNKTGSEVSIYAPTSAITHSTAKRYLLGSSSETGVSVTSTCGVWAQNNEIYADNIRKAAVVETIISEADVVGLSNPTFNIKKYDESNNSRIIVYKDSSIAPTGDNHTPVFITRPGGVAPCTGGVTLVHDYGTSDYKFRFSLYLKQVGSNYESYLKVERLNGSNTVVNTFYVRLSQSPN